MKELGCTTPFGLSSNKNYTICTELGKMKKAMALFNNMTESRMEKCPYPCKFLKVLVTPSKGLFMYIPNNFNHYFLLFKFTVTFNDILRKRGVAEAWSCDDFQPENCD